MTEKELRKKLEEYANKAGFKLNPDEKILEFVLKGLVKNKEKHGEIYCPCRVVTGDKEKDKEIICPCVFHKQEIKETGHCKCNLFFAKSD
ncbi:ferredoxin:thioredoxin reductase [Candidatus Pacearchaeota archaeon]|nr:ferredoxin:thioredoxin reductase [Candidatus Pacearchaeota archaeon]